MNSFLRLSFLPYGSDFALLILRLSVGVTLLASHGIQKLTGFSQLVKHFPDPLRIGSQWSLTYAVFCEVFCALLLIVGLGARWAAFFITINMAVAFTLVHRMRLTGEHSGELALLYLAAALTLFIAGAGKFSLDDGVLGQQTLHGESRSAARRKFRAAAR